MSPRSTGTGHRATTCMKESVSHTIVVTGGTRGIGRAAIDYLAAQDVEAHLVLLARGDAGSALAAHLTADGHTASSIRADLLSLASTSRAADEIVRQLDTGELPPLRGFVGNAGLQFTNDLTESPDGFEATFAVNVLANHVLLHRLRARITTPGRVVITVSDTHFGDLRHNMGMVPGPSWQDPAVLARTRAFPKPASAVAGRTAYSTSKLAAIYLIHEYARRLPDGIEIIGFNPGFVPGTGLARDASLIERFATGHVMPLLALTPIASSQKTAGKHLADVVLGRAPAKSGAYVDRTRVARSSDQSYDPDRERRLWETVEELTNTFTAQDDATREPLIGDRDFSRSPTSSA